jgi:hypothetical protein
MADFLVFLAQSLSIFGRRLSSASPVPWPLLIAALLPAYVAVLSTVIWWMRGRIWQVRCAYPNTTRGHACRNPVIGEWSRCHHHRGRRQRRTDQHVVVPELRRWETVTRSGHVSSRDDEVGRGVLRMNGRASTLLYRRGFARPPMDVRRILPAWWREVLELARVAQRRLRALRDTPRRWRTVLWPAPPQVAGVADRLPIVIRATRASVYTVAAGLVFVLLAATLPQAATQYVNYGSALFFVSAWAILKQGVWLADDEWMRLAAKDTWRWAWPFLLFSVIGGMALQ